MSKLEPCLLMLTMLLMLPHTTALCNSFSSDDEVSGFFFVQPVTLCAVKVVSTVFIPSE